MEKIKLFEMFSGYGGASFALKNLGVEFEVVGFSEIDKYAIRCYQQNHQGVNFGDCTKINPEELPDFDLLTGGFPCQSFSVAGKGLGEQDTRGTLFHEIIRIAEIKKPKYMLLENVKGLTNKKHAATFAKILSELKRIGYAVKWEVLNSKNYGIPQNRERVFFYCQRFNTMPNDCWDFFYFHFPKKEKLSLFLKDILEDCVVDRDLSYCIDANYWKGTNFEQYFDKARRQVVFKLPNNTQQRFQEAIHGDGVRLQHPRSKTARGRVQKFVSQTLQTSGPGGVVDKDLIRKLTPKECFRLMGFLDDNINLEGISNTQRYKLAGNGWDINLVSKIFKEMFKK